MYPPTYGGGGVEPLKSKLKMTVSPAAIVVYRERLYDGTRERGEADDHGSQESLHHVFLLH